MSRALRITALAAALMVVPAEAQAQSAAARPEPGVRMRADLYRADTSRLRRITAQSLTGTYAGSSGDTILISVRPDLAPLRLPAASVRSLHVSRGRPARWREAVRRAWVSALLGASAGAINARLQGSAGAQLGAAAVRRGATAAALSAAMGALFPREQWARIHLSEAGTGGT